MTDRLANAVEAFRDGLIIIQNGEDIAVDMHALATIVSVEAQITQAYALRNLHAEANMATLLHGKALEAIEENIDALQQIETILRRLCQVIDEGNKTNTVPKARAKKR